MRGIAATPPLLFLAAAIMSSVGTSARPQEEPTLDATRRVLPDAGAGFRAVRRGPDGSYYVLAATTPPTASKSSKSAAPSIFAVLVFDAQGRKLREIPAQRRPREIVSGSSLDVDAAGRVYVADAGGNAVIVYGADGTLFARLSVPTPTQIVALPHDQFAVHSANSEHLIALYDLHGALVREFGELADLSDDADLNHRFNVGHLAADEAGNLFFAFRYLPEPTVRKYNPTSGQLLDEMSLTTLDLQPMAQSARQEIARIAAGKARLPHEIISGFGVDPQTQEFWLALGNLLMHFDNADNLTASSRAYTPDRVRLVPNFILVEKDHLLLGGDPLGIYEFPRFPGKILRP
jgi:hypothetical protein